MRLCDASRVTNRSVNNKLEAADRTKAKQRHVHFIADLASDSNRRFSKVRALTPALNERQLPITRPSKFDLVSKIDKRASYTELPTCYDYILFLVESSRLNPGIGRLSVLKGNTLINNEPIYHRTSAKGNMFPIYRPPTDIKVHANFFLGSIRMIATQFNFKHRRAKHVRRRRCGVEAGGIITAHFT